VSSEKDVMDSPTDNPASPEAPAPDKPGKAGEKINWVAELRGLALMLLGVVLFHTLIAKPFYIPSESMLPNMLVGDRLVVSKYPYGWSWVSASFHVLPRSNWRINGGTPEYGDIVIAVPPNRPEDYIKRVVALPGDRIALVNGQIILNGKPVPQQVEPAIRMPVDANAPCEFGADRETGAAYRYDVRLPSGETVCEVPTFRETLPNGATYLILDHRTGDLDNYAEITVPKDHVFLMGDNRDHSADSRAPVWQQGLGGAVPLTSVGGRAEFITFSLDGTTSWNPVSWFTSLRGGRAWRSLRPAVAVTEGNGDDRN
jgi:signal peptidase I